MKEITLSNFRCFREAQTVRLAPLTLLVGENSTGKTSFMALIRALWDIAYKESVPDFKESPYDLGSFDEIVHYRGARGSRASEFSASFKALQLPPKGLQPRIGSVGSAAPCFEATFRKRGTVPFPAIIRIEEGKTWIEQCLEGEDLVRSFGTDRGSWTRQSESSHLGFEAGHVRFIRGFYIDFDPVFSVGEKRRQELRQELLPLRGASEPNDADLRQLRGLCSAAIQQYFRRAPAYASAPVRSIPHRTYDPASAETDSEGQYVPMYLANISDEKPAEWGRLKARLEQFGQKAGLFDEILIRRLGARGGEPFQLQVRKFSGRLKGPWRNLVDVGYGVSQALPVVTELMRKDHPPLFLLQQPEVHLHPSAQAALGTLFCEFAGWNRQLVVETHSDHLLDRVRMDIRDRTTTLSPEDVSILFFERNGLDVSIHSLRIDENGNVLDAPGTYRRFFLDETSRSIGI